MDPVALLIVAAAGCLVLSFVHAQLLDRREKRHDRWKRREKHKKEEIEAVFANDNSADGTDTDSSSGDGESGDADNLPVEVEAAGTVTPTPNRESCDLCGRSSGDVMRVPTADGERTPIGDHTPPLTTMAVCRRESCIAEAKRRAPRIGEVVR